MYIYIVSRSGHEHFIYISLLFSQRTSYMFIHISRYECLASLTHVEFLYAAAVRISA